MKDLTKIRLLLIEFIVLLALSGITAFPLRTEMEFLAHHKDSFPDFLTGWIEQVNAAILQTPDTVLYGTDWLAFAHLIIALFFIPVYRQPQRYIHNLEVGMIACGAVFLLAFICGPIRGIPFFHQLIDCSFGLLGFIPLWYVHKKIKKLEVKS